MKKIYFLAAACAAMSMASCSTETLDETVLQSDSNLISFNVNAGKSTKADITTANIEEFNATAIISGDTTTQYFDNVTFAKNGQTFNSADPYYWPQNDALDFFAYAPIAVPTGNTLSRTNYKTFVVTPSKAKDADYVDFIYANTDGKTKANSGANGVQINFRHAESKIVVRVKNSAANLQFDVKGWRLGYLSDQGTFVYADADTDGNNGGTLTKRQWTPNTALASNTYTKTFSEKNIAAKTSTPVALEGEMILIPQTNDMATKYTDGATKSTLVENGSYIGLDLKIYNTNEAKTVIFNGSHDGESGLWAMWPVNIDWEPGKKYTYTIDLCGGGYYEVNQTDINEGTDDLDPILGPDAIIKFVDVTVDDWSDAPEQEVNMLLTNPIENAVASFKPLSDGAITYSGDKDKTVTLTAKTTDLMWPGFPELTGKDDDGKDINANNNNVFNDMMSFFNGLYYTGSPVQSVNYNEKDYAFAENIELVKALAQQFNTKLAVIDEKLIGVKADSVIVDVTIKGKFQDEVITDDANCGVKKVTLKLVVGTASDNVMLATEIANNKKEGSGVFSSSGTSVKLTASVEDFKWDGFPTVEGKDTNNNLMFKNVDNFCKALFTVGFNSVSFNSVSYTSATATDLAAALAGNGFGTFWEGGVTIKTTTFSTSLTADGTTINVSLTAE